MKRSIYLISIVIALVSQQGLSQHYDLIEGTINEYTAIQEILCGAENDVDSVLVSDASLFTVGDTVMIYCVQGSEIVTDTTVFKDLGADALNPRNTGRYAFLIINEIEGQYVVFNNRVTPHINAMGEGEKAQLIRVPSYRYAEVTPAGLTAKAWDNSSGGVITLFANVLRLDGPVNVSGSGFWGAREDHDYLYDCISDNPQDLDSLFFHIDNYSAGKKGDGITDTQFEWMRGRAKNINGGGGGNGLFSGGGGGANFTGGGSGGDESSLCVPGMEEAGGEGGFFLEEFYYKNYYDDLDIAFDRYDRIFFGGGGGTGTRKSGTTTSDGGNGGGLVVIVADSIIGNGNTIFADGEDALTADGAAGGGGGGGCIILDVNGYRTSLNLSTKGGDGGNTNGTENTGPGGGGGGGVYWMSGSFDDHSDLEMIRDNGRAGESNIPYGAGDGGDPGDKYGLYAPIRGFIFNPVPTEYTVCSDQVPEDIVASEPKGGDGPETYTYLWVDSSSTQNSWLPAPEGPGKPNNLINYEFPGPLADTAYFRRIVNPDSILTDTSFRIAVYVHQAIENNTISASDTVCYGDSAKLFIPSASIGGGLGHGSYSYLWQKDEFVGRGLEDADGDAIKDSTYQTPGLITSTEFYRIARSGVCADTSSPVFVQVWEKLTNYQIKDNDTVCYNLREPNLLNSVDSIGGGDPDDLRYQWITSYDTLSWTEIPGAILESYQPPVQIQTNYYSRIVLSGSDNACVDTSKYKEMLNINLIESNTISETQTVCKDDDAETLTGSDPSGGLDDVQFRYVWESRTKSSGWIPEADSFVNIDFEPGTMDGDTTWYRRYIGSGGAARNVCFSYSNVDTIHVLPLIDNNLITTSDSLKCEDDMLEWLTQDSTGGKTPVGGDGSWIYQWQVVTGSEISDSWDDIAGATGIDYTDQPTLDGDLDRWYRRHVYSGPDNQCQDFSDILHVTVHTGITGNTINLVDTTCLNSYKEVLGDLPFGEDGLDPTYTWIDAVSGTILPGVQGQNYSDTFRLQQLYQFEREVQIGACTSTSDSMLVTVMELPGGMLSADLSQSCETEVMMDVALTTEGLDPDNYILPWNVTLRNGVNENLDGPYSLNESGEVEVTLNTDADSTQFNYTIAEISYTSVTDRYICVAPENKLSGIVPIMVYRTPEPQITVDGAARDSFEACNTTIELEASTDRGNGAWSFDPSSYINASQTAGEGYLISIPKSSEAFGTYSATFTSTAGVCSGADSIGLTYWEQPDAAFAGEDTILFLINSVQLNADPPTAGTGTWSMDPMGPQIEDINSPTSMVYNLEMGVENIFTWTITNGLCQEVDDFSTVVRTEVKRYQGFSPNGDLDNEYYIMQGMVYADAFTVTFFNSLGNTVRTITDENVDEVEYDPNLINGGLREDELVVWEGRSENGSLVPKGTYYYVVNYIKYQRDPNSGNITRTDTYEYKDYVVVLRD